MSEAHIVAVVAKIPLPTVFVGAMAPKAAVAGIVDAKAFAVDLLNSISDEVQREATSVEPSRPLVWMQGHVPSTDDLVVNEKALLVCFQHSPDL